jgi:hypothetical protein
MTGALTLVILPAVYWTQVHIVKAAGAFSHRRRRALYKGLWKRAGVSSLGEVGRAVMDGIASGWTPSDDHGSTAS